MSEVHICHRDYCTNATETTGDNSGRITHLYHKINVSQVELLNNYKAEPVHHANLTTMLSGS